MALGDFFRINFPYGITQNEKGEWLAFNREYMPLGWNSTEHQQSIFDKKAYSEYPVYTKYSGVTEAKLKKIAHSEDGINRDDSGKIVRVFLYNDRTNPQSSPKCWDAYFDKVKILSKFIVE